MGSQPSVFVPIPNADNKDDINVKNGQNHAAAFRQNSKQSEDCQCFGWLLSNDQRGRSINGAGGSSTSATGSATHHQYPYHVTAAVAAATHEILGTPLPDTPVTTRSRHRQQEANAMNSPVQSQFGVFGSKKAGSESETNPRGGSFRSVLAGLQVGSSTMQQNRLKQKSRVDHNPLQIHDGPVCVLCVCGEYSLF
jgi:hypothetical protein